jgi:Amt family ammonium transporter
MTTAIDSGHTAWILMSMALVQFMLPGLAFFYAGLLHRTSVVTMIMQNYASMGVVTVVWFLIGFSLCFGEDVGSFIGNPATFGAYKDVGGAPGVASDIPGLVFAGYQGMFAVITPALMTGAFADRLRFMPYLLLICVWIILVYCPFCHWIWGGGWMATWGVVDFAGGIVVHTTAGFSALAAVHFLGSRAKILGTKSTTTTPHNIPFVALGTALLWFGWFGFNGGSALGGNSSAAFAAVNSEIAASTALTVWMIIDWYKMKRPSLVGVCVGAIAGLATITPCAAFIRPWAAFVVGIVAAVFCYGCCELKNRLKWDDALDVWGVHGMGGAVGSIMCGVFADKDVGGFSASGELFGKQLAAVVIAAVYSYLVTILILLVLGLFVRLKPTLTEISDPDKSFHGESAYNEQDDSKYAGTAVAEITAKISGGSKDSKGLMSILFKKKEEGNVAAKDVESTTSMDGSHHP